MMICFVTISCFCQTLFVHFFYYCTGIWKQSKVISIVSGKNDVTFLSNATFHLTRLKKSNGYICILPHVKNLNIQRHTKN